MAFSSAQSLFIGLILLTIISALHASLIEYGDSHNKKHDHDSHEKHYCGSGYPPGLSCPRGYYGDDYTQCCKNGYKYACCKPPKPTPSTIDPGKWMQPWSIVLLVLAILFVCCAIVMLLCACCSCCYWAGKRRRREYVVIRDQPQYNYSYSTGGYRV